MVLVNATSDFLIADARAALGRRFRESCRTELSRAFAAWLLREAETNDEFALLVSEVATREGAQQDFQSVAILGFGAASDILGIAQIQSLKKGLQRQAGRQVIIDGVPVAFCSDAVGILGVALGTKAVADANITGAVVKWFSKFLKDSYDRDRTEDWQRLLFVAADRQLGNSLNLSWPKSPATADVRRALITRGLIEIGDNDQAAEVEAQTLKLAIGEPQNELPCDRAILRLAAVESVLRTPRLLNEGREGEQAARRDSALSKRDLQIHDAVGGERFRTLRNAEIMKIAGLKKRLRSDFGLEAGNAAKGSLDRIRQAKGYPLSREIAKKRSTNQ
jgi:hypothetical protein